MGKILKLLELLVEESMHHMSLKTFLDMITLDIKHAGDGRCAIETKPHIEVEIVLYEFGLRYV